MPHDPRSDNTNSNSISKNLDDRKTQLSRHAMLGILAPQKFENPILQKSGNHFCAKIFFCGHLFSQKTRRAKCPEFRHVGKSDYPNLRNCGYQDIRFPNPPGSRYPTIRLSRIPKFMAARIHGSPVFQTSDFIGLKSICQ